MGKNPYHNPIGKNIYYKYQATPPVKGTQKKYSPSKQSIFSLREELTWASERPRAKHPPTLILSCFCRGVQRSEPADRPSNSPSFGPTTPTRSSLVRLKKASSPIKGRLNFRTKRPSTQSIINQHLIKQFNIFS